MRQKLVAALVATALSPSLSAEPLEKEEVLLAVELDQEILTEALPALTDASGTTWLPLGQLASVLSLAIDVDPSARRAEGFVIDEARRLVLDVDAGSVRVGGERDTFTSGDIMCRHDDLYVASSALAEWLPVSLEVVAREAAVRVTAREMLPLQIRRKRERLLAGGIVQRDLEPSGPRLDVPWVGFDGPFIDHALRLETSPRRGLSFDHSTHVTAELVGIGVEGFARGTNGLLTDGRITVGRQDPDGGLFGPLHLSEFLVGEVLDGGTTLLTAPRSGRGVRFGNFPLHRADSLASESFRGPLPSGWLVELHQDGALVDMAVADEEEIYEFLDIPLHDGANELELVFRGPRGEIRQETIQRQVGSRHATDGRWHWRISALDGDDDRRQALASFDRGLGKRFAWSSTIASVENDDGRQEYLSTGLQASLGPVLATADAALSRDGGVGAEIGVVTRLGGVDMTLRHAELSAFESPYFARSKEALRRRSLARLTTTLEAGRARIPLALVLESEERLAGGTQQAVRLRTGLSTGRTLVTHELAWRHDDDVEDDLLEGRLLVRQRLAGVTIRADIFHDASRHFSLQSATLGAEAVVGASWFVRGELERDWQADTHRVGLAAEWTGSRFGLGGEVGVDSAGVTLALTVRTSVARRRGMGWHVQAEPLAGLGAATAIVFIDEDGDGTRDPGERPIAATVRAGRTGVQARTDATGQAFLASLPPHREVTLSLDPQALDDPLAMPSPEGVRIVPRPGRVARVELPVVLGGDIAGTVVTVDASGERAVGGAQVRLLDSAGRIVAQSPSAHDGFFNITRVPPGTYQLEAILPRPRAMLASSRPQVVRIEPTGTVLDGLRIVLGGTLGAPLLDAIASLPEQPRVRPMPSAAPLRLFEGIDAIAARLAASDDAPQDRARTSDYQDTAVASAAARNPAAIEPPNASRSPGAGGTTR